jgi:hypothetical protein
VRRRRPAHQRHANGYRDDNEEVIAFIASPGWFWDSRVAERSGTEEK